MKSKDTMGSMCMVYLDWGNYCFSENKTKHPARLSVDTDEWVSYVCFYHLIKKYTLGPIFYDSIGVGCIGKYEI